MNYLTKSKNVVNCGHHSSHFTRFIPHITFICYEQMKIQLISKFLIRHGDSDKLYPSTVVRNQTMIMH